MKNKISLLVLVTKSGQNLKWKHFLNIQALIIYKFQRFFLHRIDFEVCTIKSIFSFSVLGGKAEKPQNTVFGYKNGSKC